MNIHHAFFAEDRKNIELQTTKQKIPYMASLMLTKDTFFIAFEHRGCNILVVTLNAFALGFASTLTKQPTLILFPFISCAPVRNVAAPETVHGVGSTP